MYIMDTLSSGSAALCCPASAGARFARTRREDQTKTKIRVKRERLSWQWAKALIIVTASCYYGCSCSCHRSGIKHVYAEENSSAPSTTTPQATAPNSASKEKKLSPALEKYQRIHQLSPGKCRRLARKKHIKVESLKEVPGVQVPVRVKGPIAGISLHYPGRNKQHEIMDCRLLLALHAWFSVLHQQGVEKISHMSAFRPKAKVASTRKPSGHATGLAIDIATLTHSDGQSWSILDDWKERAAHADPCTEHEKDDTVTATLRKWVCDAATRDIFQIIITPHHNKAHANHVHVEVVPNGTWSFVR